MNISGREKRNLDVAFIRKYQDKSIYLGLPITEQRIPKLKKIGFLTIEHGETILPASIGKKTSINAYGQYIIHRNRPKETVYHMVEWEHDEWHGPYTERKTDIIDRPYRRYPRTQIAPLSKELSIFKSDNKQLVISEKLQVIEKNYEAILHIINIFLEIFGECSIYDENLEIPTTHLKKVNWKIFPKGQLTPEFFEEHIRPILSRQPESAKRVIWYRFDLIKEKNPEFIAVGQGGFKGYLVFGFPEKNIFVLESLFEGNATYIFDENWELLSKRTKLEILSESLQKERFIHKNNWVRRIRYLLNN
jgi:hypothetical protein